MLSFHFSNYWEATWLGIQSSYINFQEVVEYDHLPVMWKLTLVSGITGDLSAAVAFLMGTRGCLSPDKSQAATYPSCLYLGLGNVFYGLREEISKLILTTKLFEVCVYLIRYIIPFRGERTQYVVSGNKASSWSLSRCYVPGEPISLPRSRPSIWRQKFPSFPVLWHSRVVFPDQ